MYWPISSARRLHLSPSGLHALPPATEEEAAAQRVLAQANGPSSAPPSRQSSFAAAQESSSSHAGPSSSRSRDSTAESSASGAAQEDLEELVDIARSRAGTQWATLSAHTIGIWSTRPAQVVAALRRTRRSVDEYGANRRVHWRPNGLGIVVETTKSFLLLYTVTPLSPAVFSYVPPNGTGAKSSTGSGELLAPTPAALQAVFHLAPGEHSLSASSSGASSGRSARAEDGAWRSGSANAEMCELRFNMVLKIDAGLGACVPTEAHLVVSTLDPPAVQAIPWPDGAPQREAVRRSADTARQHEQQHGEPPRPQTRTTLLDRLDWIQLSGVMPSTPAPAADGEGTPASEVFSPQEASRSVGVHVCALEHSRAMDMYVWLTSDGRAHSAHLPVHPESGQAGFWEGRSFHGLQRLAQPGAGAAGKRRASSATAASDASGTSRRSFARSDAKGKQPALDAEVPFEKRAVCTAINARFSLIAVGLEDGTVAIYSYRSPDRAPTHSHTLSLREAYASTASYLALGRAVALSWSSDGHALAVAGERGWAVWSTFGKLMACSLRDGWTGVHKKFMDSFLFGAKRLFWGLGNTELYFLARRKHDRPFDPDNQLFVLPFAKSTIAGQHSPDNTRYAFVQLDDSLLVYRGAEQPDVSIINPESDVWQHIKIPHSYVADNWPIRYACISSDGKLIAVAGRRGLAHYSTTSGRWKTYLKPQQEQSFAIRGGMQWFHHVLVAACDAGGEYQIRMYSRDLDLDNSQLLHLEKLNSPVLLTSLFEDSLLVYTADNTFYHYLITTTADSIRLKLCGSITFEGIIGEPSRVRGMSWMVPPSQQEFGDPIDDLTVAAIIFLIDGKLILLRPRRLAHDDEEVAYDMQVLADQIEFYWTHLQGIGGLENSLWGYDGKAVKVWLNALSLEQRRKKRLRDVSHSTTTTESDAGTASESELESDEEGPYGVKEAEYHTIEESVTLSLDFYPLCVLMEKGVIIGVDPEMSVRKALDFATFRSSTNTHLFLQQVLRNLLERRHVRHAVAFASHYSVLVYFAHAMEVLLHDVLEDEADALGQQALPSLDDEAEADPEEGGRLLPLVIEFLDHFDEALRVVVNCARKTELTRWGYLFRYAGNPTELFEKCLERDELRVAASYLLVLHSLESVESSTAMTVRLLRRAASEKKWALCKDLLRFLRSVDDTGDMVRNAIIQAGLLDGTSADVTVSTPRPVDGFSISTPRAADFSKMESPSIVIDSAPPLDRRQSAPPTTLDPTAEEDEDSESASDAEGQVALDRGSPRGNALFGEKILAAPDGAAANGSASKSKKNKRISVQRRVSVPVVAGSGGDAGDTPSKGGLSPAGGLGMSLSRVGLRSSDRLGSPQSAVKSLLTPTVGAGRGASPRALASASPTRTVEEFIIE